MAETICAQRFKTRYAEHQQPALKVAGDRI